MADTESQSTQTETDSDTTNIVKKKPVAPQKIGRWYMFEILGKGGYSWVKRGVDETNGRVVALKFMDRRYSKVGTWNDKQETQVKTEIEALKALKHPNIMRLFAYNLNAKYPNKLSENEDQPREVILMVLEYMPGGELFDILYYTNALEDIIARTYFRQLISAIHACHQCGIIHRDLKPQNLLLDSSFTLKLTDFGLAKLVMKPEDKNMKTRHVGTRGYQAPEILDKNTPSYTKACDLFSCGVILFILLSGYPPFEHAKPTDKWYKYIAEKEYRKFWKHHKGCGIGPKAVDLITRLLLCDDKKRIGIRHILKHPWYKDKVLSASNLYKVLKLRHQKMEQQRRTDPVKTKLLQDSVKRGTADELKKRGLTMQDKAPDYGILNPITKNEEIGVFDTYTTVGAYDVLTHISQIIEAFKGKFEWNYEGFELKCIVAMEKMHYKDNTNIIKIEMAQSVGCRFRMYYSNEYKCNILKIIKYDKHNDNIYNNNKKDTFFKQLTQSNIPINHFIKNFKLFIDILYSHINDSIILPKKIADKIKTKKAKQDVSTNWTQNDIDLYNLVFPDKNVKKQKREANDKLRSKMQIKLKHKASNGNTSAGSPINDDIKDNDDQKE